MKSQTLSAFLVLILISLALLLLENFGFLNSLRNTFSFFLVPLKRGVYKTSLTVKKQFTFLTFWQEKEGKIRDLEEKERLLLVFEERVRQLEEENRILRAQLEAPLPPSWEFLPAKTLGLTRFLAIDKGEKDGVRKGQGVLFQNIWVGKVVKVFPSESLVELPIDPESRIPVITGKTNARGILVGQFGKGILLDKVTSQERLELEDSVVTTGEGGYPKGILVGKIEKIEKKEEEIFQKAQVKTLLPFKELEMVFVVL